jgi:hypothetical protein
MSAGGVVVGEEVGQSRIIKGVFGNAEELLSCKVDDLFDALDSFHVFDEDRNLLTEVFAKF